MSINPSHISLAQSLPKRLLNFFRKYPPPALTTPTPSWKTLTGPAIAAPESARAKWGLSAAPGSASAPAATSAAEAAPQTEAVDSSAETQTGADLDYANPFLPTRSTKSRTWYSPRYSLRQQADLVKLASKHGVLDLLPYTIKHPEVRLRRRLEGGLRVKGTGVGEKVKGKSWERTLKGRLEERRQAMRGMGALVEEWKQVCFCLGRGWRRELTLMQKGHGRGWKKWPK